MKRNYFITSFFVFSMWMQGNVWAAERFSSDDDSGPKIETLINLTSEETGTASGSIMYINGTNSSESMTVNGANLKQDIVLTSTAGFKVSPSVITAGSASTEVKVTLTSTMAQTTGQVILRSGDVRSYVKVIGYGTSLSKKDLSQNPIYAGGKDEEMSFENFAPGDNGYTLEFKAKTNDATKKFYPYAITKNAVGFKGYVTSEGMGLYNSTTQKALSNPSNGGTFYNTDGLYHTYRYAVTSDKRVFVYRDGLAIDTLRLSDLALQPEFTVENDDYADNLLKNADFEGEYNTRPSDHLTYRIEGWDVSPLDQYNSTQSIVSSEVNNSKDMNNHALAVNRYMWSDGWGAAEISQIVDVAPSETYSFSALAKGGIKSKDGTLFGSLRIYDLQDSKNSTIIPVTSDSYQTYGADFTTSAQCKQIRVVCYLERGAGWGASVSALTVDDVKLMGMKRSYAQEVGFMNELSDVAYFNFDATGAYAPLNSVITASSDSLSIEGTGTTKSFTIKTENLLNDVTLTGTAGLKVSPSVIPVGTTDAEVKVTLTSTMAQTTGQVILRSGDVRSYVKVIGYGTSLIKKDLSQNPVYAGGKDEEMSFENFAPGDNGYTLEFKAKTNDATKKFYPYAITKNAVGFKGYVTSEGMGLYNSTTQKALSNPSNGGTFYNTDGLYHTYRYAVTSDKRVFVYRDGLAIDTLRLSDLALQPEFTVENDDYADNLLKNADFEGEYNTRPSDHLTYRIEGWDVSPLDQYNSTQSIVSSEVNNSKDMNNHALAVNRYMWSDGWGAAEISQIVDVAPSETYSFSALAKGGIKSKDGTLFGSLRIYDLQDSKNSTIIPVTSDSYQTYGADFTTSAQCKQIRVVCYLERGAGWGASVSALTVDDVKLMGMKRSYAQEVGFMNELSDVAYFNFDATGAYAPLNSVITASSDSLSIEGTGTTKSFTIKTENLLNDVTLTGTAGLKVSPSVIPVGTTDAEVKVTLTSTMAQTTGQVILRSGDVRSYVKVIGYGTSLIKKDLSQNPVYAGGKDEEMSFENFAPGDNGYTLEFKAKTNDATKKFYPYAITKKAVGFKGYVTSEGMGLYNSTTQKALSNPSNGGTFYNTDGLYHTYRYAVTSDKRVFVYRDGLAIDTLRLSDLALQPEFTVENDDYADNLLKNADFEGEYNTRPSDHLTYRIEGWDVSPLDQYNSTQSIVSSEVNNSKDMNNHALAVNRYMWSDGWGAAEISQIVDVAPSETYSFSALAKGGIKSKDGTLFGSLRIYDLQDSKNSTIIPVTSDSYQTYGADFTTSAQCKQIRVVCYLERGAGWGASVSALTVDDVKLMGMKRSYAQEAGFMNELSDVAYFNFDATGAYAPLNSMITTSADDLVIDGTGESENFTVATENLINDITLTATAGLEVSPTSLPAGTTDAKIKVTLKSTMGKTKGQVILRSGDVRSYVKVTGYGTPLSKKDLSQNPVYAGGKDEEMSFENFAPTDNGYTLEFMAKTNDATKNFYPYAITKNAVGFKGYVTSESMGLYNSTTQKALSNPSNGGTFYNTDGLYHTYRYAVTSDKRVFVYRDGLSIDTLRLSDLALQPEFTVENDDYVDNLLKNADFEGEYNLRSSDSLTYRIEGWDVSPLDQYNSTQSIVSSEVNNSKDMNNHALAVKRYMWSDGWGAAEISQIVDVAPSETYSFSALAKGGIKSDGTLFGSLRIYDLQDSKNSTIIPVTSDSYQTYGADFTTSAQCKQIRVVCYLERGAGWGASVSALTVDDVKLMGMKRSYAQEAGFMNELSDVAYFNFDATGAYAPTSVKLNIDNITAIKTVDDGSNSLYGYVSNGALFLKNVPETSTLFVYNSMGMLIYRTSDYRSAEGINLGAEGIYVCVVVNGNEKQTVKIKY